MAVVTYCLLETSTGLCVDKFEWDDTYTYTPATSYSLAPNSSGEIGWTWNGSAWVPNSGSPQSSPSAPVNNVTRSIDFLQGSVVAGDILYADDTNNFNRLPIGSTGEVLTVVAGVPNWEPASSGGKPYIVFRPGMNEPPATNYAVYGVRNNHPFLAFDTTTSWSAVFTSVLPTSYGGGGLTVELDVVMATATSGTVGWLISIERMDAGVLDIDADSFGSTTTITAATVPGTSGVILSQTATLSSGAAMDNLAAGEAFRIKIARDVANDTAAGDAQILAVVVRET